ncbi:YjaZ [Bacillus sp. SG-1]|nr:YjaZ [Bacillus sp. SG-1]
MEEFITTVKLNPEGNREKYLIDSFKFNEENLGLMLFFGMFHFNNDIDSLEKQLINMLELDYETFIKEELERLQGQYPSNIPINLELFILDENDQFVKSKLGGVSAFTEWDGRMCFAVLPEESVRKTLKSVLTHEYHHHWRISALKMDEENTNLLDRMILEGLAEHFVRLTLGNSYLGPYKDALTEQQAKVLCETKYKHHFEETGSSTDSYMFGSEEKGLPFWGGYSLGYYLVKWYLDRNVDISIEKLSLLPSEKFLD